MEDRPIQADDVRWLFAYDRWATRRVLTVLDGVDPKIWTAASVVGDRGLGGILVHHLGASQRWRIGFESQGQEEGPAPEDEPLPTIDELRRRWDAEWLAVDAWLPTVSDGFVSLVFEGVPVWQMLAHVVNHGTQHRAEAAALLTAEGRSPGELDMINYSEELAGRAPDVG
ncbi:MAG TPA: DinB family protein [Candidatus Limnocylindria bacterium]|nr:DinB family protein [Candidatus Limnocylindria bacterium]